MAQERLGRAAEARQSFAAAYKLMEPSKSLGPDWDDCLRFRIVLREAEELLHFKPTLVPAADTKPVSNAAPVEAPRP
jgi:hypothetical protein